MSRTTENVRNTGIEVYIDPAQESKMGLLILSKRINDLDFSLSSRLDTLEAIALSKPNDDEADNESLWKICDEIAESEDSRQRLEEAERRKRRRELDRELSRIRSKRAEKEKKGQRRKEVKAKLRKKCVDGIKTFISSWTIKSTYKLLFAILTIVSMLMYFMYYNIVTGLVLIIPGILMILPAYRTSRKELMLKLDEDAQSLFTLFEGYIGMCAIFNFYILIQSALLIAFDL